MRKTLVAKISLALVIALPALAWSGGETDDLRERLARTVNSLAEFTGLQKRIEAHDPNSIPELLAASEAGPADSLQAEIDLANLRARVGALQEILDTVSSERSGAMLTGAQPAPTPRATTSPIVSHVAPAAGTHTVAAPANEIAGADKQSYEAEGFVADRSRLGRACWRGGRYLEGVSALEPLAGDSQADYWRARCLEKLQRHPEAIELYRSVIKAAGDTPEGRSAREDLEFLEWSLAHGLIKTS